MSYVQFLTQNARWLTGGFLLTFFSSFGQTFFISLSGGAIRTEYDLTNGEWGTLYMLATLGSAMTLPFLGRIVDHVSVAKTVLITIPALVLATFLMSVSHSIILLVVILYALRLFGQGMMTHISITAMGRWYSAQRGRAVSVAVVGHQAGEALLPIVFVYALLVTGWRGTWLMSAVFVAVVALPVIYALMRVERVPSQQEISDEARTSLRQWTRAEVMRDVLFWSICIAVLAPAFIGTTLFFHQDYLIELRGWDKLQYSLSFTVMAIMTFSFALISGYTIDRFSAISHLPFFLIPLAAACIAMWAIESVVGSFVFMGLLGISYGISSTLFGALWPEIYGTKHLGSIRSIIIALMVFGTALGPGLTGFLIDLNVSYPAQILTMGIYCLAASAIPNTIKAMMIER
ncbi:MAG: MFS transporter, partial [Pseudomonadota bacterium]